MILTPHLLAGAAIVSKIQLLPLALILAFLSHYLLDLLFHWEYSIENIKQRTWQRAFFDFSKVALDFSAGVILIFLFSQNFFIAFAGGFLAALPDGLTFLHLVFPKIKILEILHKIHSEKFHLFKKQKNPSFWGIFNQLIIIFISIVFLR